MIVKREQSDKDEDDLKKATDKGVEEKIRQKRILREYVIVLVTENKCETFFMFTIILLFINKRYRVFISYKLLDQTKMLKNRLIQRKHVVKLKSIFLVYFDNYFRSQNYLVYLTYVHSSSFIMFVYSIFVRT